MNFEDRAGNVLAVFLGGVVPVLGLIFAIQVTNVNPFTEIFRILTG